MTDIEEAKKIWIQTIQTTVIKGFTKEEWCELVKDFKLKILTQPPSYNIIGYSLNKKNAAKFTKNDIQRLLNDAFSSSPSLSLPTEWKLEDASEGEKFLTINKDVFGERLLSHRKREEEEDEEGEEGEEEEEEEREGGEMKKRKVIITTMSGLVGEFIKTQTSPSEDKNLSRAEVWLRFFYWATRRKLNIPLHEEEFYTVFEQQHPSLCIQKGKKKYFQNFYIRLRHTPRYPQSSDKGSIGHKG